MNLIKLLRMIIKSINNMELFRSTTRSLRFTVLNELLCVDFEIRVTKIFHFFHYLLTPKNTAAEHIYQHTVYSIITSTNQQVICILFFMIVILTCRLTGSDYTNNTQYGTQTKTTCWKPLNRCSYTGCMNA